ncbi:HD-GYP domain-containing protein [Deinococcus navajonensis]|uniref:HD-GYP domain-containing protein n=1 Tax=Deinococcus navajonensis TaxID=309884 RepID=A0ABV8XT41_9DEIO
MWHSSPWPAGLALLGSALLVAGTLTGHPPLMTGAALMVALSVPTEVAVLRWAGLAAYPAAFVLSLLRPGAALGLADLLGALMVGAALGWLVLRRHLAAQGEAWQARVAVALQDGSRQLAEARDAGGMIRAALGILNTLQVAPHLAFIAYRHGTPFILEARGAYTALLNRPLNPGESAGRSVQTDHRVAEQALSLLRPEDGRYAHLTPVYGHGGTHLGALLISRATRSFDPEEQSAVDAFARLLGAQLGQWQAICDLRDANDLTLRALGAALEHRDDDTGGHTARVVALSVRLARHLGWGESQIQALRWGAYLHDLGKLAIPDGILHKAGPLNDQERQVIQTHAVRGHDMLQDLHFLPAETLDLVRYHHERWDGKGYPAGLCRLQIPESARLFSIVDVYDALTHARPYKPAWSRERALREIHSQAGQQFDPEYVNAFVHLVAERDEAQLVH